MDVNQPKQEHLLALKGTHSAACRCPPSLPGRSSCGSSASAGSALAPLPALGLALRGESSRPGPGPGPRRGAAAGPGAAVREGAGAAPAPGCEAVVKDRVRSGGKAVSSVRFRRRSSRERRPGRTAGRWGVRWEVPEGKRRQGGPSYCK